MCFRASRLSRKSTPSGVTVNWKATAWCASAILVVGPHLGGGRRVPGWAQAGPAPVEAPPPACRCPTQLAASRPPQRPRPGQRCPATRPS